MRVPGTRSHSQVALLWLLLGSAVSLPAQGPYSSVDLSVCNKGAVPVEVVAAQKNSFPMLYWDVDGTNVLPGECKQVYWSSAGYPAYIAFGLTNARGRWESGTISQVPDLGIYIQWFQTQKILTPAGVALCAQRNSTSYRSQGDMPANCAGLKYITDMNGHLLAPDAGNGPLLPLTSAFLLQTVNQSCYDGGVQSPCHLYLNIAPSGTDRELHATPGTGGAAAATSGSGTPTDAQVLQALAAIAAEDRKKQEQAASIAAAAAAAERRRQAQANSPEGQLQTKREQQADREQRQKQVLAADAAGNPNVKVEAQMIRREDENNRQRWAGTRQSPANYAPEWMNQNMVIVGTISRVEVDPNGSPQWVTIYFKESPDSTFVVCSPYPDLFQERVGLNLSALVGKTLEAAGQVESPYCGGKVPKGSIRVVESKQWQVH